MVKIEWNVPTTVPNRPFMKPNVPPIDPEVLRRSVERMFGETGSVMVTQKEAAAMLNVSIDTIRRWRKSGRLQSEERMHGRNTTWYVSVPAEIHEHHDGAGDPSEVEALRREVADLRERLASAEQDRSRLIELLYRSR